MSTSPAAAGVDASGSGAGAGSGSGAGRRFGLGRRSGFGFDAFACAAPRTTVTGGSRARTRRSTGCSRRGCAVRAARSAVPRSSRSTRSASGLERRPRFPARQAHERDLEHEARIGGVGAAHVDHGLPERLERADEHRRRRPARRAPPSGLLVVAGEVDAHAAARRGEQERVAHRREEVLGEPARLVSGVEQLAERDERAGDVFVGDGAEDRQATVERGAAEERVHLLDVDRGRGRSPGRAATASRASSRRRRAR